MSKGNIFGFLLIVTIIISVSIWLNKYEQDDVESALNGLELELTGSLIQKDSIQQNSGVIEIHGRLTTNKYIDDTQYMAIQGSNLRIMVDMIDKLQLGDSIEISSEKNKVIIKNNLNKYLHIKLTDLILTRRTPVYYDAKAILSDFKEIKFE